MDEIRILPKHALTTHSFEITPDDKSFILSQGSWKHDAVLIGGLK